MVNLLKKIGLITVLAFIPISCSHYSKENSKVSYEKSDTIIEYSQGHRGMQGKGMTYQWGREDSMKMMYEGYRIKEIKMGKGCEMKCKGKENSCDYKITDTVSPAYRMREMEMMKRGMMQGQGMNEMRGERGRMEMAKRGKGMMKEGTGMQRMAGQRGRMHQDTGMQNSNMKENRMMQHRRQMNMQETKEQNGKIFHYE